MDYCIIEPNVVPASYCIFVENAFSFSIRCYQGCSQDRLKGELIFRGASPKPLLSYVSGCYVIQLINLSACSLHCRRSQFDMHLVLCIMSEFLFVLAQCTICLFA